MSEVIEQFELPDHLTIYIGGKPVLLSDLQMAAQYCVKFRMPDGNVKSIPLSRPFYETPEGVAEGVAIGLHGLTEQRWLGLTDEGRAYFHDKEADLCGLIRKEAARCVFRGSR